MTTYFEFAKHRLFILFPPFEKAWLKELRI